MRRFRRTVRRLTRVERVRNVFLARFFRNPLLFNLNETRQGEAVGFREARLNQRADSVDDGGNVFLAEPRILGQLSDDLRFGQRFRLFVDFLFDRFLLNFFLGFRFDFFFRRFFRASFLRARFLFFRHFAGP